MRSSDMRALTKGRNYTGQSVARQRVQDEFNKMNHQWSQSVAREQQKSEALQKELAKTKASFTAEVTKLQELLNIAQKHNTLLFFLGATIGALLSTLAHFLLS